MPGLVPGIHVLTMRVELKTWMAGTTLAAVAARPAMTVRMSRPAGRRHIGRTSVTSGTKWRSRFWMPCLSVAVEDGQPEQAPFMFK
jgi:hypothetical protein